MSDTETNTASTADMVSGPGMGIQLQPPEQFNFRSPEKWTTWLQRFERYRKASGLSQRTNDAQVSTLIYVMGPESEEIINSLKFTDEELNCYDSVITKLNAHFIPKRNLIYERAKFNLRVQQPDETVDSFVTALHTLANNCEYKSLREELIRDRLVVGLTDKNLSEKLQLDSDLTLQSAVLRSRQSESVKKQQSVVHQLVDNSVNVDRISKINIRSKSKDDNSSSNSNFKTGSCFRCGRGFEKGHMRQCPALNAHCNFCKIKGHFASVCNKVTKPGNQKDINEVQTNFTPGEIHNNAYLGTVDDQNFTSQPWRIDVRVDDVNIQFKVDPGADVTVISEEIYNGYFPNCILQPSGTKLFGACGNALQLKGKFSGTLSWGQNAILQDVYVLGSLKEPLLGRPAIERLGILQWIHQLSGNINSSFDPRERYPSLFTGLGKMKVEYEIKLKPGAQSHVLSSPRRVALPLRPKLKEELERMEAMGVISPVEVPTEWCSGIVIVPKPNGKIRLCVDLTKLNNNVRREHITLPTVDESLANLRDSKVFSKLDANCGYWQIPLAESSRLLTTFITPFGRYCFNRLPFGISSAPEFYSREMMRILAGTPGVICHMDDVLIFGKDEEEHFRNLDTVLQKLAAAGVTLNEKCVFNTKKVKFLGHIVSSNGIEADPTKCEAITKMPDPESKGDVRRLLGMVTYIGKFLPNLSQLTEPLRRLLKNENDFYWGEDQRKAFSEIKKAITSPPVLCHYDASKPIRVCADASSFGAGAILEIFSDGHWRPVMYASRSFNSNEMSQAQIEKEALALTWACDRFATYIIGKEITLVTDHRPLVSILGQKCIDELSPRLQRYRMRLMRYSYKVQHVSGKSFYTPDTLSRAPVHDDEEPEDNVYQVKEIRELEQNLVDSVPATDARMKEVLELQENDFTCRLLRKMILEGWPKKTSEVPILCRAFWGVRGDLTIVQDMIMKGNAMYIPSKLRKEILMRIHDGHMGIYKSIQRAKDAVWWPGITNDIKTYVSQCTACLEQKGNRPEPLISTPLPQLPWQVVGTDLAERGSQSYLIIIDYYSRYPEVFSLSNLTTSKVIIERMKSAFARHGIPQEVRSDNGPQYISNEFKKFSEEYGFRHVTSSPRYPQSNGQVEGSVKIVKNILSRSADPYLGLLSYRNTPLVELKYSPAQLLMGRKLRDTLPSHQSNLKPETVNVKDFTRLNDKSKERQKRDFDRRHRVVQRSELKPSQNVWIRDCQKYGVVRGTAETPRSVYVETDGKTLRRNTFHLTEVPSTLMEGEENTEPNVNQTQGSGGDRPCSEQEIRDGVYKTRFGRVVRKPERLNL
jgi:transposase InsO family protein